MSEPADLIEQQDERVEQRVEMSIKDLIPPSWQDQQVWVSSYRAYGVPRNKLLGTEPFELLNVRCQLFWGGAPYWQSTLRMNALVDGNVSINVEVEGIQHSPDGPYLVLMTPTEYAATPTAEEETRSRLRSVLGLLHLALGRNIAVEPLGELILASTGEVTGMTPAMRNPTYDPPPSLSDEGRQLVSDLGVAVSELDEQQRNRLELSLQWFFRAEEAPQGVTAFLLYWFALESLAMPGSEKIGALENRLARVYQLDQSAVRDSFRLGKLYGLRGDIVHHGHHPSIHSRVLDFMTAVYWDLLLDSLRLARAARLERPQRTSTTGFPLWRKRRRPTLPGEPRMMSRRKQIENGSISSIRQAAAAYNVSPPVIRRWLLLGLIPGPPWTVEQLHEVRDLTDPESRRRGNRAAHGTITRWNAGCSCAECRQFQSDTARARGRRRARERLPTEVRQQLLNAVYEGTPFRRVLRDLKLTSNQVWGLAKTDEEWSAALEAALTATRRGDLKHGTNAAYVRGCVCRDCREHQRRRMATTRRQLNAAGVAQVLRVNSGTSAVSGGHHCSDSSRAYAS